MEMASIILGHLAIWRIYSKNFIPDCDHVELEKTEGSCRTDESVR